MKRKNLIIFVSCLFLLTGCSSSNLSSAKKMDDVLLNYVQTGEISLDKLNNKEKKLVEEFIESEKIENKVVNLSSFANISDIDTFNNGDTIGVYEKNGNFYIKYIDIDFVENSDSEFIEDEGFPIYEEAIVYYDGKILNLFKDDVPLIPDETKLNLRYNYAYRGTASFDNAIVSYYNSIHDDTGLRFVFYLENKRISDIDVEFDVTPSLYTIKNTTDGSITVISIIVISAIIILVGSLITLIRIKKAQTI